MSLPAGFQIAIEGVIGVGKSSLARILAEDLGASLVLEEAEENPFLPDFYRDQKHYALQTQLCFLLSRHRQQSQLKQLNLFNKSIVSDYLFDKDRIFAHVTLQDRELELYNRIADFLSQDIPVPDLVIYLQSNPQRLLTNIRVRDIDYERMISLEYLEALSEAYKKFFFQWDKSSLLIINSVKLDFVNNPVHRELLVRKVSDKPAGTTYFNPES